MTNFTFPFRAALYGGIALLTVLLASGCKPKADTAAVTMPMQDAAAKPGAGKQLYQCSMHPNVVSDKPGKCPICGMDLQPVKAIDAQGIPGRAPVQLTGLQEQLINIRTAPVQREALSQTIRAEGIVRHDSSKIFTVAAWTAGRIDRLYVDQEEMMIEKGQPLYAIYSPELTATMQNYQLMRARGSDAAILDAIRVRLREHGLSDGMIRQLDTTDRTPDTFDIPSPAAGLVMDKMVRLGAYVKEGDPLYTIVDLSKLWLIVEVYESELPFIAPGQRVTATTAAVPGRIFTGTVELVNHLINSKTRTAQVRVVFNDASQYMTMARGPDGKMEHHHLLLPDMWMNAQIERDLGEELTVPAAAVFNTGNRQYVFVERSEGIFAPVIVTLGPKVGDHQVLSAGVSAGDHVVVDGNFLLDSESQLKAAATGPGDENAPQEMPGMDMGAKHPLSKAATAPVEKLLTAYEKVRGLLAHDRLEGVAPAAEQMKQALAELRVSESKPTDQADAYKEKLAALERCVTVLPPPKLESAREQFGAISTALIDLFKSFPPPLAAPLEIVHCPMWSKSAADWLQPGKDVENPFLGQQMPTCGNVVGQIGEAK